MTRLFRILVRVLTVLLVIAGVAAGLAYYVLSGSLPDYDKTYQLMDVTGRVEIVRDNHAVPHIFAEHEQDLFYGLGYAHAEDRLWQLLMLRRTAQGRLSEVFGERTLKIDRFLRAIDLYGVSAASLAFQSRQDIAVLEAYSNGINARIRTIRKEALGRGAPELFVFDREISPWTPTDSMAVMRYMALRMTDKASVEVLQARLSLEITDERLRDLFPTEQGAPLMALPDYASLFDAPLPGGNLALNDDQFLMPLPPPGSAGASNAFAANANRTATGGTLLATDPHMTLTAPSIWFLARLEFPEGGVIGATIPGIPSILIGRNANFGWGTTASYLDDQDIFIEKLDPENDMRYLTPSGFEDMITRQVIIEVAGQPGITFPFRRTRHGPVIDADLLGLGPILPEGHVAALAWTALDPNEGTLGGMLALMRARTVEEAREAIRDIAIPSLNFVMADTRSIAIQTGGRAPNRNPDHTSRGRIPAPGWLSQNDWRGYLPFDENPYIRDPQSGIVVNTNNRLTDAPFPNHWAFEWGDEQRILRAEAKLNEREFHTLDSFIEIQTDTVSPAARTLLPLIARDLWWSGQPSATGTLERRRQMALELLADWNGDMSEHDAEPLIYAAWIRALQRRLIIDDVGTLESQLGRVRPLFIERVFRDVDGAGSWCDTKQTTRIEDCTEVARLSLDEALLNLVENYGSRIESWRWGDAHQALHRHEFLGQRPFYSWILNIKHDTPGGDNTLLRGQLSGDEDAPFLNTHAAGFRAAYDFSDLEASVFIISTGQSGHFLSSHYDDLAQIWRRSEYIPMTLDPVLARGGNLGVTVLVPPQE